MTNSNSSTNPKTVTEQVQEYLERDLPRSVLIDAYRTGKHEPIVRHVKEHYGRSTISYKAIGDLIGIETVVRDAIQNIALKTSPYKELAALPTMDELAGQYGQAAAIAINDERNQWLRLVERQAPIPRFPFRLHGKQMFDDGDLLIATFEKKEEAEGVLMAFNALLNALKLARQEIDILPPKQRRQRETVLKTIDAALRPLQ